MTTLANCPKCGSEAAREPHQDQRNKEVSRFFWYRCPECANNFNLTEFERANQITLGGNLGDLT